MRNKIDEINNNLNTINELIQICPNENVKKALEKLRHAEVLRKEKFLNLLLEIVERRSEYGYNVEEKFNNKMLWDSI